MTIVERRVVAHHVGHLQASVFALIRLNTGAVYVLAGPDWTWRLLHVAGPVVDPPPRSSPP